MKYIITIELTRKKKFASVDIKDRIEQLLIPEHLPKTIKELNKIINPLHVTDIKVESYQ
jgi:hypothetical protein